jgi:hypothetical protein
VFILKGILMFKRLRLNSAKSRLVEERLYEMVMDELDTGNIRRGIWAKAVAKSNGNDNQARSKYLELRVESLKDEAHVIESILKSEENKPDVIEPEPDSSNDSGYFWWGVGVVLFCIVFISLAN